MFASLALHSLQKALNTALSADSVSALRVRTELGGKSLRFVCLSPNLSVDVFFDADTGCIYLEPTPTLTGAAPQSNHSAQHAHTAPFSQPRFSLDANKALMLTTADVTLTVETAAKLVSLFTQTSGNLPITGDYKVLYGLKDILINSQLNMAQLVAPYLGAGLAGQLDILLIQARKHAQTRASQAQFFAEEWMQDSQFFASRVDADKLKQDILKLNIEIERQHARLDALIDKVRHKTFTKHKDT